MNYEALYKEFGQQQVGIIRRELTQKNGKPPGYIQLYAALCLAQGHQTPPTKQKA